MQTASPRLIHVYYESLDSYGRRTLRVFKTLKGAQRYAQERVGAHPEMGGWYAVSGDGIGKVMVTGATLNELFPLAPPVPAETLAAMAALTAAGITNTLYPYWGTDTNDPLIRVHLDDLDKANRVLASLPAENPDPTVLEAEANAWAARAADARRR